MLIQVHPGKNSSVVTPPPRTISGNTHIFPGVQDSPIEYLTTYRLKTNLLLVPLPQNKDIEGLLLVSEGGGVEEISSQVQKSTKRSSKSKQDLTSLSYVLGGF